MCALGTLMAGHDPAQAFDGNAQSDTLALITGTRTATPTTKPTITPTPKPSSPSAGRQSATSANTVVDLLASVNTGSGDNTFAYDGDTITYTISITNVSGGTVSDLLILDLLPQDALDKDSITCTGGCQFIYDSQEVPQPIGGTILVTITRQISWTISSLAPNAVVRKTFAGRLAGQADGEAFTNRAFVSCLTTSCNAESDVTTNARVRPIQIGTASLSVAPTWFSSDLGGTIAQDWGDFDHDGRLDLALASSTGTTVYRNVNGQMEKFWGNTRQTFGVVWGDFANDGTLRLVTVGDSADKTPATPGNNYVYMRQGNDFVQTGVFTSDCQLVRVAASMFGGNGSNIDVVASTNTLNAPCPVKLYRNDGSGNFPVDKRECISNSPTAAIGIGDFNNDGFPDIVIGQFPNTVKLLVNDGTGHFAGTTPISTVVDTAITFLPYDFKWGDYDGDGFLDLAAAFPLQREVRIYHNNNGLRFDAPVIKRTNAFLTPLSIEWNDFSGDSHLDLAVGDTPPVVYQYVGPTPTSNDSFATAIQLPPGVVNGQLWSMRGVQVRNDGTVDLALSDRDGPSVMFNAFTPHLSPTLRAIDNFVANSVAWGDLNSDGMLDLLFGAGSPPAVGSRIYYNVNGAFNALNRLDLLPAGLGPQSVAVGDVNGDGNLDVLVGTPNNNQLYLASSTVPTWTTSAPASPNHVVAFGDINDDGRLDLAVGSNGGPIVLFLNRTGRLGTTPVFTTPELANTRAIAFADYDKDGFPDFAVANFGGPARIYRNNHDNSFSLAWSSPQVYSATSVAFSDYNGDGFPDLTLGNFGQRSVIFENIGGTFGTTPLWQSDAPHKTTAIAWGDWNNDGFPELAIGNEGEPTQVYANFGSRPGTPRLQLIWSSREQPNTTGLAWGDFNGDGYLDLATSQRGGGQNGVYVNTTILPSNFTSVFTPTLRLPNNPPYVTLHRPGHTDDAYLFSSSELIGTTAFPTVTIQYRVYDPDGMRTNLMSSIGIITPTFFEYSVDGGSTWQTASRAPGASLVVTATRAGQDGIFYWDAGADQAISNDARFRVRVVHQDRYGPIQRASASAISPPFRVRGTWCTWPTNASFVVDPLVPVPGAPTLFTGTVEAGSGVLNYGWDFGDGGVDVGQFAQHTYALTGTYTVRLTVTGDPCPITRESVAKTQVYPGGYPANLNQRLYLPLVSRFNSSANASSANNATPTTAAPSTATATATAQNTATASATPRATNSPTPSNTPTNSPLPVNTSKPTSTATSQATTAPTNSPAPSNTPKASAPLAQALDSLLYRASGNDEPRVHLLTSQTAVDPQSARTLLSTNTDAIQRTPLSAGGISCTNVQVTNINVGINNQPVVNGDGTRVAFWSTYNFPTNNGLNNADGNIEIFVANLFDIPPSFTQVTSSTGSILGGFNLSPIISNDGRYVAFFSDRNLTGGNADGNFEVFRATIGQTGQVAITQVTTTTQRSNILPSMSSDGRYLAFVSDADLAGGNPDGNSQIFRAQINNDGSIAYVQVTTSGVGIINDQPTISGDGSRIAWVSNGSATSNNREIFFATVGAAGEPTQVSDASNTPSRANTQPSFNGDSTVLVFVSGGNIFLANVGAGVAMTQLTTNGGNDQPSTSADGTRVSYISSNGLQVSVVDTVLGGDPQTLNASSFNAHPFMSADGTHTAFLSGRNVFVANCPFGELAITKSAPATTIAGAPLTYTMIVRNFGPSAFTGVIMTDVLPTGVFSLTVSPDQTDDDNTALGFGGGVNSDTRFINNTLTISPTVWEVPNNAGNTWFNAAGNVVLLHLNEAANATTFSDSSGSNNNASCGTTCPTAGVSGALKTAISLDGVNQYATVADAPALNFAAYQNFALAL